MNTEDKSRTAQMLRARAEAIVREAGFAEQHAAMSPEAMRKALDELRVHQIELEIQNEELRRVVAASERYCALYDMAPVGFCTLSAKGHIREANFTAGTLLGMAREALVKQPIARFILKDDQVVYYFHRKRLLQFDDPQTCELRMVKGDGAIFWARMEATTGNDESGDPVFRVMISDISERKRTEARLQLAACVFSHAREGIMITDADGVIVEVNRAFTRITGYPRDEALGRNSRFLSSDRQNQAFFAAVRRALTENHYWSGEVWNRRKDDTLYAEMQTISVVPDVQGNVRQIVTLFSDITALKQAEEALAESLEQRRLFIEYAPAGLAMFDRDMRYLYTSNRWFADHGLSKRDLYGLSHYDVFPEIPEEWKQAHRRGLAGEVLRSEGDRFERLDGSVKWVRWELRPWYNAQQTIGGIVIFTEDITANKKAEEALRASEERLSLVLRGTQDGFWDWDLLRNKVHYSLRWWSMLGYAEGELEAAPDLWRRLTHPDDLERIDRDLAAALAGSTDTYEAEFRLRHREGHYLHIIARALILRDGQGQAIRVAGANRDVSENRRVENALREQEQFFRLITENLEGFVSVLDVEGRRVYNSPSYARLLGHRNLSGTLSFGDIHPADRERVMQAFRETVATGIGQHLEFRFVMADGGICWLESRSGVIRDQDGRTKRVVVVSHDVTERKAAEDQIRDRALADAVTRLPTD